MVTDIRLDGTGNYIMSRHREIRSGHEAQVDPELAREASLLHD